MKKLLSTILAVLMLTTLLASCGASVNTNTDTNVNTESNTNIDDDSEPKSLYELAVEAGFEGTLEEWGEAIANVNDTSEDKNECTCQNSITMGEAILIAQTHYFAVYYADEPNQYMIDIAELYKEDLENWYIMIAPRDVTDDGETFIHKGQCYLYTISKETGAIIEIDASGE